MMAVEVFRFRMEVVEKESEIVWEYIGGVKSLALILCAVLRH